VRLHVHYEVEHRLSGLLRLLDERDVAAACDLDIL